MILVLLLAVACAVASASLVALHVLVPRRSLRASLARAASYGGSASDDATPQHAVAHALARVALRLAPSTKLDAAAEKLAAAGLLRKVAPATYLAVKTVGAAAGVVAGFALGAAGGSLLRVLVLPACFAYLGFRLPDVLLTARIRRRREEILEELPNALDLLAVSVEAGLGLDAAVARFVDVAKGPLADEFALLLAELRVGAGRHDVLHRFAERVPAPETAAFVRAVTHADRLGTSLTQTLRVQAHETRLKRQAVAEEKAGKAPVRTLFPTVLFIFPSLFVVVLGPAVLVLLKVF